MLTSITVETLTQIWQRVLDRSPIGSEENFFDLGGDDLLADLLFTEIAFAFGRQLPRAAISYAPTIAALAALLEEPGLPARSPFVQMKPGSEQPPIFIVHGLGGRTAEFYDLVRRIQTEHPIYGIQAKGIDGFEKPLERVEDMARSYLAVLDETEPRGPYLLIGYSFGGLVALEMAQQLSKIGKHVALLVLLDTYPDARSFSPAQRLHLVAQRVKFHLNEMRRLPLLEAKQWFVRKLAVRRFRSNLPNETVHEGKSPALSLAQAALRVEKKAFLAMASYRPRTYHGKITFIAAAETKSFFLPPDPALIWRDFAEEFELDTIPVDHMEMVTNDALASALARYSQEATSPRINENHAIADPARYPIAR